VVRYEGFWEPEIHALLRERGGRLLCTPEAVVRYQGCARAGEFARQRLAHGRRFGQDRIRRLPQPFRVLLLAAWPLTPVAFLARICRDALAAGSGASLIGALPALLWFLGFWSAGELLGYLSGVAGGPRGRAQAAATRSRPRPKSL